jgi:hypothetical protein
LEKLRSYPKLYNIGHKAIEDLFKEEVLVQEKLDGSQISFCRTGDDLAIRSKGAIIHPEAPEKMFSKGVESILKVKDKLKDGWLYRGEYLQKPKHNVLSYDRVPDQHIAIFDIETEPSYFLDPEEVFKEALRLGFSWVPFVLVTVDSPEKVKELLEWDSFLGGTKVEGIAIKNYNRFTLDGKTMMGKYVSERFKEVHRTKKYRTSNKDIIETLVEMYKTEARWLKAIHHLRDMGEIENSPRDIGKLFKEVHSDVRAECEDEIKEILFKWAWKQVGRGITRGLAEWYKEQLLEKQFEKEE